VQFTPAACGRSSRTCPPRGYLLVIEKTPALLPAMTTGGPAMLNIKTLALSAALVATAVAAPLFGAATQTFAAQRDFTQVNASRVSIVHMYVTASNDPDWGDDVLQHGPIAPGTSRDIGVPNSYARGACLFDMELDASDGTVTYQTNVDLCQGNVTMTFS
jgi:hypothetical protein